MEAMTQEEIKDSLWLGKMTSAGHAEVKDVLGMLSLASIKDKELLLNAAIALVDFRYLEETVQTRDLTWLNRIAQKRPAVILHLCGPIVRILDDIILSCQNAGTLEAAHSLLRTLTSNDKFIGGMDTAELLDDVLDGIGFGGLWRSSTFHIANPRQRQCTALTDRLIE
ncbi:hypothetical protein DH86_00002920, partial [Scytalidium sp. 3C]